MICLTSITSAVEVLTKALIERRDVTPSENWAKDRARLQKVKPECRSGLMGNNQNFISISKDAVDPKLDL